MNTAINNNTLLEVRPNRSGFEDTVLPAAFPPELAPERVDASHHWSWSCRRVSAGSKLQLENTAGAPPPAPGDLALVRVESLGFHKHITTGENRRLRLYPGAQFVGVFGNRYASAAFEAEVLTADNLSLLTGAGMIGTVKSKHAGVVDPTQISMVGYVRGADGVRVNLQKELFRPAAIRRTPANLIYIVGTSMNSGKTTTCARLVRGLGNLGLTVVACKLTGSVSNHDPDELAAAAAHKVTDFSDFGFASTYMAPREDLLQLFRTMLTDVAEVSPDVVLMEFADGLLQRETAMLLREPEVQQAGAGVVLTAGGSISALWGVEHLRKLDYRILAVSGRFTSSPLAMREYTENDSDTPVVSSGGLEDQGVGLVSWISSCLKRK